KMLRGIRDQINSFGYNANAGEVYDNLTKWLGKGDLLIVDEAQHLDDSALETLRGVHDSTGCGIVIGGNPHVITRYKGARKARFEHFLSRIGMRLDLDGSLPEDFDAFFDHHQVRG